MSVTLLRCLGCLRDDQAVVVGIGIVRVVCGCGWAGPPSASRVSAVVLWNTKRPARDSAPAGYSQGERPGYRDTVDDSEGLDPPGWVSDGPCGAGWYE